MKLIMEERGNGFPDIGDLVGHWDESGNQRVWRVTRLGRISTGGSGYGNTLDAHGDELDGEEIEIAEAEGWDPDDQTVSVRLDNDDDESSDHCPPDQRNHIGRCSVRRHPVRVNVRRIKR